MSFYSPERISRTFNQSPVNYYRQHATIYRIRYFPFHVGLPFPFRLRPSAARNPSVRPRPAPPFTLAPQRPTLPQNSPVIISFCSFTGGVCATFLFRVPFFFFQTFVLLYCTLPTADWTVVMEKRRVFLAATQKHKYVTQTQPKSTNIYRKRQYTQKLLLY